MVGGRASPRRLRNGHSNRDARDEQLYAEVLRVEEVEVPPPAEGEVQVRHTAIGLNFIDVYDRTGLYPVALPAVPGREAAGVVMAIGRRAKGFRVVGVSAYALPNPGPTPGSAMCATQVVKLPKST